MTIARLDQFGFLAIDGRDAVSFLQGYTTCDLTRLNTSDTTPGAICNIQGRMIANFIAARTEHGLLVRLDRQLVPVVIDFLTKYIVFSKATMQDASDAWASVGLIDVPAIAGAAVSMIRPDGRIECWVTADDAPAGDDKGEWQAAEVAAGIAWVTTASSGEYIPQMFGLHDQGAIDFDKGCYLGQEIVARMQYRGELKKRLHIASISGVAVGDAVSGDDGKALGEVVATSESHALAVLRNTEEAVSGQVPGGETTLFRVVQTA